MNKLSEIVSQAKQSRDEYRDLSVIKNLRNVGQAYVMVLKETCEDWENLSESEKSKIGLHVSKYMNDFLADIEDNYRKTGKIITEEELKVMIEYRFNIRVSNAYADRYNNLLSNKGSTSKLEGFEKLYTKYRNKAAALDGDVIKIDNKVPVPTQNQSVYRGRK